MRPATADAATASPLDHSVDAEGRFWEHADALSTGPYGNGPVVAVIHPPADQSVHLLRSPVGQVSPFRWLAEHAAWAPQERMRRLAFAPDWLGSHGWAYLGPVPVIPDKPRARSRKEKS